MWTVFDVGLQVEIFGAEGFDDFGEGTEVGVLGVGKEAVEDGFRREYLAAHACEGGEYGSFVLRAAGAEAVAEEGDIDVFFGRLQAGLVDADGDFEADDEEVVDFAVAQVAFHALGAEGGEGLLGEDLGVEGEFEEFAVGVPEFFGSLLGEKGMEFEAAGGFDGEGGAFEKSFLVVNRIDEAVLGVDYEEGYGV